jgi:(S)-sulfolactate dehydrogenase
MADILVTEFMRLEALEPLRARFTVDVDAELWSRPDDLISRIAHAKALIVRNRTQITAAVVAAAPNLRAVGRLGVGLDNIDLNACRTRDIAVLPALGANAVSVAEYVLTAILWHARGAAFTAHGAVAQGRWPREAASGTREIAGRTLGLVGLGSIGRIVATRAAALGLNIVAYDAALESGDDAWRGVERVTFQEVLSRAEFISLHCPLTDATRGLIGAAQISTMRRDALLINTARGGIVDHAALADALRTKRIGGAVLDVFEPEPIGAEDVRLFEGIETVVLTPHVAGVTVDSNERISDITVQNVLAVLTGVS